MASKVHDPSPAAVHARDVLRELEPRAEALLNRHLSTAKEWFPHQFVPWSRGRDFSDTPWSIEDSPISRLARTSFEVNLLTEDNLPSYHRFIYAMFRGHDGAWVNWVNRWTAEEGRHAMVLRDYLTVTRSVDPTELERDRMRTVSDGYDHRDDPLAGMAYTAIQELATRISHLNTGRLVTDPVAQRITARIAQDENLHMIFYRDMVQTAFELAPSDMMSALTEEIVHFQMPGAGMPGFGRKALLMAEAGVYNPRIHHTEVLAPLLRYWRVFERSSLSGDAELARERLARFIDKLDALAREFAERLERRASQSNDRGRPLPRRALPRTTTRSDVSSGSD